MPVRKGGFSMTDYRIPAGMSLEQFDEYARKVYNRKRREKYAEHPEKNLQNRIAAAIKLLERNGYTVAKAGVR